MVAYDAEREDCCGSGELGDLDIEWYFLLPRSGCASSFGSLRRCFYITVAFSEIVRSWKIPGCYL